MLANYLTNILDNSFDSVNSSQMIQAPDVALSTCEVTLKPQSCSRRDCGHKVVRVVAVSDFIDDGDRWTRIITEPARSQSLLWKSHDPPDVDVSYVSQVMPRCAISVGNESLKLKLKFLRNLFVPLCFYFVIMIHRELEDEETCE